MANISLEDNNSYKKDIENASNGSVPNVYEIKPNYLNKSIKSLAQKRVHDIGKEHPKLLVLSDNPTNDDPTIFSVEERGDGKLRFYTGNIMGFLDVKDEGLPKSKSLQIKISSRFEINGNDYFLHYLLQCVSNISIFHELNYTKDNNLKALDWLMLMFPSRLKKAFSQGLFREYQTFRRNDTNIRGVIDVPRHIRHNMPFHGKVAYNTREYTRENPMMQLVRHTIECIDSRNQGRQILRSDAETRAAVDCIRQYTPKYSRNDRSLVIADNMRPVAHPFYTAYKELQDICLRILRQERLGYGDSKDSISGVLFDGAWLWEEYIAKITTRYFKHYTNSHKEFFLFREKREDGGYSKPFQWIIPDYLGLDESGNRIVADAKYIPLSDVKELSAERAEGVYYKTVMYMYRFNAKIAFLFYPYSDKDRYNENNNEADFNEDSEEKILVNDFMIDEREDDCHLYKIGLKIPSSCNGYPDFVQKMKIIESQFESKIKSILS